MSTEKETHHVLPDKLDPSLFKLKDDEAAFYKSVTGIDDDEDLKQHIFAIQKEAFEVRPLVFFWIAFAEPGIVDLPVSMHPSLPIFDVTLGSVYNAR